MRITWKHLLHPGAATDFFSRRAVQPFKPGLTTYDTGNALCLAELSRLVYRRDEREPDPHPGPTRSDFLKNVGLREKAFIFSHETDTQAVIVEPVTEPLFAVLVFRGTEQRFKDLETDLSLGLDSLADDKAAAHDGFEKALDSVWSDIEAELADVASPVFFTGHSLGAALATLAAARHKPAALYTFASPRVGNSLFVDLLRGVAHFRHVHGDDIVPELPPELLGYRHTGKLKYLPARRPRRSFNPISWIRMLFLPPQPLADHAPENYVDRI